MTAAMLVLEPIFEADLPPEQHAYRPGRSAHDAVRRVHALVNTGHREVIDAPGKVGKEITHRDATLPVLLELEG